jgi:peptidoglycan/xylan/chitin deacetylase (PgdA/CDA1 family)
LWIVVNVEHYELLPPPNDYIPKFPRVPHPDVQQYARRDYGNRVGLWRLLEVLDAYDLRVTAALNVAVLEHFAEVRAAMVEREWSYMLHRLYNTRDVFGLEPAEELAFYKDMVATVKARTGRPLRGNFGPAMNAATPELLVEAGMTYSVDWSHDDQPAPILVSNGRLVSIPYTLDLNDNVPVRGWSSAGLAAAWRSQFDCLWREGARSGQVMCMALHPFVVGQPEEVGYLDQTLKYIIGHDGVWSTTAEEVADFYLQECYDEQLAYATWASGVAPRRGGSDAR